MNAFYWDLGGLYPALWSYRDAWGRRKTSTPTMHGIEKSDETILVMSTANNGQPAEQDERRVSPKGKTQSSTTHYAQKWVCVSHGMERLRQQVERNPTEKLTTLLHHINEASLKAAYFAIKRDAAPGLDGMMWAEYGEDLDRNIADLCTRVHRGTYRAAPSRRVDIPKPDGSKRRLGIATLEDKIVQCAMVKCILEPIYEHEFEDFSYGFRAKRGAHDALDAIAHAIERKKINYVVDADIRKFFDMVDQQWLMRFLEHRIADKRVLRIIKKWLQAGVIQDGIWQASEVGTPQGAVISPILANIYLHYVLDLWYKHQCNTRRIGGESVIVRYADDFVVGFQYKREADRFLQDLRTRLKKFGLCLHPDKTRLIEFGRFAEENRRKRGEGRPVTFDFLGFTHFCGKTRHGRFRLSRKPIAKRMDKFLNRIRAELTRRMHRCVHETGKWLGQVLNGWLNYYAVPTSYRYMRRCYMRLKWIWLRILQRRSQKDRTTWDHLDALVTRYWPKLKIRHPWPDERHAVKYVGTT